MNQEEKFEALVIALSEKGYAIMDYFINDDAVAQLVDCLLQHQINGTFKAAGIRKTAEQHLAPKIRGDQIVWLNAETGAVAEQAYLKLITAFQQYLNHTCYTGIIANELHYSCYHNNQFYKRHLDVFKTQTSRAYSIILYLNLNWQSADAGELVLYTKQEPNGIRIAPLAGRLVCFESADFEHEVLATTCQRYSITGWLLR